MLEVAPQIFGACSAVLLIVAIAAWVKLFGGPELQRLNGRAARNVSNVEVASQLLVLAVGVGSVAAILAIVAWISP
jgi:hypothetical protein